MKKNYKIEGMSCGGCVNGVKHSLMQVPEISDAQVQLQPPRAVLTMNETVDVGKLQDQLSKTGSYKITELPNDIL